MVCFSSFALSKKKKRPQSAVAKAVCIPVVEVVHHAVQEILNVNCYYTVCLDNRQNRLAVGS